MEGNNNEIKPLTEEQLAKINKPYFEMEKRKNEEKLNPKATPETPKDLPPLTEEQLAKINEPYFEMEKKEFEKRNNK
jgi:hypothetical protein